MFLVTNFYFRNYEFLCSSLSFFENKASILHIEKSYLGMVKIVSVLLPMFTSENEVGKIILARQLSSPLCIAHYQYPFERNHNALIICKKTCFSCPILLPCTRMSLIDRR
jgi:hypothetical protein